MYAIEVTVMVRSYQSEQAKAALAAAFHARSAAGHSVGMRASCEIR
jgi:hypothetical protein